jgi:hypothetical protein
LRLIAFIGGLTYFGSSAVILEQMIISLVGAAPTITVLITLLFMAIPALLGYGVTRVLSQKKLDVTARLN